MVNLCFKTYIKNNLKWLKSINTTKIINANNNLVGHSTVFMDLNGDTRSGGLSEDFDMSLRIALAEALERDYCFKINQDDKLSKEFMLDKYPTTCGFAAGFEEQTTKLRAIAEATERWAWSNWIDAQCSINEVPIQFTGKKSQLANYLLTFFDKVNFYRKEITVYINESFKLNLQFAVVIGIKDEGVFPGSRVCLLNEDPWEHGIIEAWRHLRIYKNRLKDFDQVKDKDIIDQRIYYFANNKSEAFKQINTNFNLRPWTVPKFILLKTYETINLDNPKFFLWRALCDDFHGWHLGDEKRFVY